VSLHINQYRDTDTKKTRFSERFVIEDNMNLSIELTLVTMENDLLKSGSLSVLPVISKTNYRSSATQDHISRRHHHSLRVDGVAEENIFYPDMW